MSSTRVFQPLNFFHADVAGDNQPETSILGQKARRQFALACHHVDLSMRRRLGVLICLYRPVPREKLVVDGVIRMHESGGFILRSELCWQIGMVVDRADCQDPETEALSLR